jgi:hypothetical protein
MKATIDPTNITTLEEWSNTYLNYQNVVQDNGVPTVLSRTDTSVVKRIPFKKGVDFYTILQRNDNDAATGISLETALDTIEEKTTALKAAVVSATPGFLEAERLLLEATDAWRLATTPVAKHLAALRVGGLTARLQVAHTDLRSAELPGRTLRKIEELSYRDFDYTTGDDRKVGVLAQLRNMRFPTSSRVLTEGDTA